MRLYVTFLSTDKTTKTARCVGAHVCLPGASLKLRLSDSKVFLVLLEQLSDSLQQLSDREH